MRIQITLRSGAQIEVDVSRYKVEVERDRRARVPDRISGISWRTPREWRAALEFIDAAEIAAVVALSPETAAG